VRSALVAGLASVAALPLAIYLTRFSERYELLHAGFAIPVAAVFGLLAVALAGRARRRSALGLGRDERNRSASVARVLGIVGVCMAVAALVSLGVYGLLEYVGSRD
jgi:peptidoglycan/LPS O-acetylase OafA/YrhL